MKVIALPEVREYLMELIQILYKKEYFGFEENAQKYVEELIFDIKNNLPLKLNKPAPPILTGTERRCYTLRSGKIRLHNGMYFSMSIRKTVK